jgi:hypothetical protein
MQQLQELIVTRLRERGVDVIEAGGGVGFDGTACRVPLRMSVRIIGLESMSGHALLALSATTPLRHLPRDRVAPSRYGGTARRHAGQLIRRSNSLVRLHGQPPASARSRCCSI